MCLSSSAGLAVWKKLLLGLPVEFEVPDDGTTILVQQSRGQFAPVLKVGP